MDALGVSIRLTRANDQCDPAGSAGGGSVVRVIVCFVPLAPGPTQAQVAKKLDKLSL